MIRVIERKNIFQKTKDLFVSLGIKNTVGLAFVLLMGGGFIVTLSMLGREQDIRQRASEITPAAVNPVQMTTSLKASVTKTNSSINTSLNAYLYNVLSYLSLNSVTGKAVACQQLTGFKDAVTAAITTGSVEVNQGSAWITRSDSIRGTIPCSN